MITEKTFRKKIEKIICDARSKNPYSLLIEDEVTDKICDLVYRRFEPISEEKCVLIFKNLPKKMGEEEYLKGWVKKQK